MNQFIKRVENHLGSQSKNTVGLRVLKRFIGLMIIFRSSTEIRFADFFWASNGIGQGSTKPYFGNILGGLLDSVFEVEIAIYILLILMFISGLMLLLDIKSNIGVLLATVVFFAFEGRLPIINDGGDNITRITLIYLLFTFPVGRSYKNKNLLWLGNLAILAIKIQICILYFISGLMKAHGEYWHNGTAMYYISRVEWFSHPALRDLFLNPVATTLASYIPMIFMIMFPVAIISRVRLIWIFTGICLHIGIGIFMGLISFSLVMIGLELFFLKDSEYETLTRKTRAFMSGISTLLRPSKPHT